MGTWILTDPATLQYVKHIRDRVYHFIDSWVGSDEHGFVWQRLIDLDSYVPNENFVEMYLNPFGYESVYDVVSKYGQASDQVLIECIGEIDSCDEEWIAFRGTEAACEDFIHSRIENDMRARIRSLEPRLSQAEQIKEQAVSDLTVIAAQYGSCFACKNKPDKDSTDFCRYYGKCSATPGSIYPNHWEWRGIEEEHI